MTFHREQMKRQAAELAAKGIFIGTSSWKYPGWCGTLYETARYEFRGRFAKSRFERNCLREYSDVFKTVCVDAAYYNFPTRQYLENLAEQTSPGFLFGLKVTDAITVKKFPNLRRFGDLAGKPNPHFLNADAFVSSFLVSCEAIRSSIGLLMFEFSRFWPADYQHGREFIDDLERFLAKLPRGWPFGVEIRNRPWLRAGYFECLARHQVSHVFNSWEAMPSIGEQMELPGSRPNPNLVAARFLLKPGRKYEDAVKMFQPYDQVKEENTEARAAGRKLIAETKAAAPVRKTFLFVNNRLEGNALGTIAAMLQESSDQERGL